MFWDQKSVVIHVRDAGLDGYPPDWSLICIAIGHQLLQLQGPSTDEAESRAHGAGTVHVAFPQRSQRVGVVEGDAALLKVKAHAEPGRQRVGEAWRRGGAVVSDAVALTAVMVVAVLGQVDLPHAHSEEAERRSRVQSVLCPAVVTTVRVITGERAQFNEWGHWQTLMRHLILLFFIYIYPHSDRGHIPVQYSEF